MKKKIKQSYFFLATYYCHYQMTIFTTIRHNNLPVICTKIIMTHWNIARRITRKQVISLVLTQNKNHLPPFIHLEVLKMTKIWHCISLVFVFVFFLKQVTLDILFCSEKLWYTIFSLGNSVCNNDEYSIANWYLKF